MIRTRSRSGLARKSRSQRYALKAWQGRLKDVPCFIMGNGPSLLDHPFQEIDGYFSIGVNRIFYVFDPVILMWQDVQLWTTEYNKLHNTQAIKVCRDVADPRRVYFNFFLRGGPYRFDPAKTHIISGRGSTGPLAIQLAVSLGCSPLILLGCDCKPRGEDTDFYGPNKDHKPHTMPNCLAGLEFVRDQCPVEIINCSDNDLWPQRTLKEVLAMLGLEYRHDRQYYVKHLLKNSNKSS